MTKSALRWRRIPKDLSNPPGSGGYSDWKECLAVEADFRCVYCGIHEGSFGGRRNFHVDHYRPKVRFPDLLNEYMNLFYACAICNGLKRDDWPSEPDPELSVPCYPNPAAVDYALILVVEPGSGIADGANVAAKYLIWRLGLNRPQAITDRRFDIVREHARIVQHDAIEVLGRPHTARMASALRAVADALSALCAALDEARHARPYGPEDTRRGSR